MILNQVGVPLKKVFLQNVYFAVADYYYHCKFYKALKGYGIERSYAKRLGKTFSGINKECTVMLTFVF